MLVSIVELPNNLGDMGSPSSQKSSSVNIMDAWSLDHWEGSYPREFIIAWREGLWLLSNIIWLNSVSSSMQYE